MMTPFPQSNKEFEGVIPINKPSGMNAFFLVKLLRNLLGIKKIGHAGTLDPFAEGVMVMLIGKTFTRLSDRLLNDDKEYIGTIHLGIETDTYDCDGKIIKRSDILPTKEQIEEKLKHFQGQIEQIPPMYSAKKVDGKKLYELARKGKVIERKAAKVNVFAEVLEYQYPFLKIHFKCSKGTYIRSLAHDLGQLLDCGGHLVKLLRTRSGSFTLKQCYEGRDLCPERFNPASFKNCLFDIPQLLDSLDKNSFCFKT